LASREKNGSPPKRPGVPLSTCTNEVSAKLAFRPPPRSSVPLKPNQEVVMPPLLTALTRPASPAARMAPTYASTVPSSCTELWAWAAPANKTTPIATAVILLVFTDFSRR
jgi:hypothetical protein